MTTAWRAIGLIARQGIRTAMRQRLLPWAGGAALVGAVLVLELRTFHFGGGELRLVADLARAGLSLGVLVFTLGLTVALVGGENGRRARTELWSKGVSFPVFVVGQWLGVLAGLLPFLLLLLGVAGGLLAWAGAEIPWLALVRGGILEAAKGAVVAAAVLLLCGLVRSGVLAAGLGLLVVLAAQLRGVLVSVPAEVTGARLIAWLVPDLGLFDRAWGLESVPRIEWSDTAWLAGYAALYAAALLVLAIPVYRHRED